jgi:tRNA (guanine-N7-)-methyltransferase
MQEETVWLGSQMPYPTEWHNIFGRTAPIVLEIGFGGGHFLVDMAKKRPDVNLIGVEISNPSIRRAAHKVRYMDIENVALVYGDAKGLLWGTMLPETLQECYINFPDPWRKSHHYHRRVIQDDFLQLLATRMPANGILEIATDHADYQDWITDHMIRQPYFTSTTGQVFVTEDNQRLRTKYERQALAQGVTCHYYKYRRNDTPAENIFPIPPEIPMPHAVIQLPLTMSDVQAQFQPFRADTERVNIRFVDLYQATRHQSMLLETYVSEEPQSQRVGLIFQPKGDGTWKVSVHEIGFPRPSAGIQMAVYHATQWLLSLHPDAKMVRHNLAVATE